MTESPTTLYISGLPGIELKIPPSTLKETLSISLQSPENKTTWTPETFDTCTTKQDEEKEDTLHQVTVRVAEAVTVTCDGEVMGGGDKVTTSPVIVVLEGAVGVFYRAITPSKFIELQSQK